MGSSKYIVDKYVAGNTSKGCLQEMSACRCVHYPRFSCSKIYFCDLKVELRTGSVYSRCLSSYGCMQKFGEHDRHQCIAESNSNFSRLHLYF